MSDITNSKKLTQVEKSNKILLNIANDFLKIQDPSALENSPIHDLTNKLKTTVMDGTHKVVDSKQLGKIEQQAKRGFKKWKSKIMDSKRFEQLEAQSKKTLEDINKLKNKVVDSKQFEKLEAQSKKTLEDINQMKNKVVDSKQFEKLEAQSKKTLEDINQVKNKVVESKQFEKLETQSNKTFSNFTKIVKDKISLRKISNKTTPQLIEDIQAEIDTIPDTADDDKLVLSRIKAFHNNAKTLKIQIENDNTITTEKSTQLQQQLKDLKHSFNTYLS